MQILDTIQNYIREGHICRAELIGTLHSILLNGRSDFANHEIT